MVASLQHLAFDVYRRNCHEAVTVDSLLREPKYLRSDRLDLAPDEQGSMFDIVAHAMLRGDVGADKLKALVKDNPALLMQHNARGEGLIGIAHRMRRFGYLEAMLDGLTQTRGSEAAGAQLNTPGVVFECDRAVTDRVECCISPMALALIQVRRPLVDLYLRHGARLDVPGQIRSRWMFPFFDYWMDDNGVLNSQILSSEIGWQPGVVSVDMPGGGHGRDRNALQVGEVFLSRNANLHGRMPTGPSDDGDLEHIQAVHGANRDGLSRLLRELSRPSER